jgi:hypothetical protein
MKWLIRAIALWTALSGAGALLLFATHLDLIGDHLDQPTTVARTAGTAAILAACAILGVLMIYAGVQLWRLRERGRKLVLSIAAGMMLLMLIGLVLKASGVALAPLLVNSVILAVLASRPARVLCGSPTTTAEVGPSVA